MPTDSPQTRPTTARRVLPHVAAGLVFAVIAVAMLWPLPQQMGDHVVRAKYRWDAYTNTSIMGARVHGVLGLGQVGIYDNYFFAPIPDTIAFNENLFGLSLLFAPVYLISGNPILAYNAVLLLSLILSAYFTFLLVRRLTGDALAGVVSGVAFAFCPYIFFEMGRVQLVATQWLPLALFFLHRAFETKRIRDVAGFALAMVLQIGTCLYYAMFLLPFVVLIGTYLWFRHRPFPHRFYVGAAIVALVAGGLVLGMTAPYFAARERFEMARAERYTRMFDGKLSHFTNVSPLHRTLTGLHDAASGPDRGNDTRERVAFPGFTVTALALCALALALRRFLRGQEPARRWRALAKWAIFALVLLIGAAFGTLLARSMAIGLIAAMTLALVWQPREQWPRCCSGHGRLYLASLIVAVALFLGMVPFLYLGKEVVGLFYYLHTYVPGFDGIRKVSRQAITVMLMLVVVAGFGVAMIFQLLKDSRIRVGLTTILVLLIATEFWHAPLPLVSGPVDLQQSKAYAYLREHPAPGPIAVLPAAQGVSAFNDHPGQATHNYLALWHRHRVLNGKSSFIPPIANWFHQRESVIPDAWSTRVLQQLGVAAFVVHTTDMPADRARTLLAAFDADPQHFRQAFAADGDYVYELALGADAAAKLVPTVQRPSGHLVPLALSQARASASPNGMAAHYAIDDKPRTFWTTRSGQTAGDWFEVQLTRRATIAVLELSPGARLFHVPLAYTVEAEVDGSWREVHRQEELRLFADQVFRPKQFVWRVVLDRPVTTDRLRVTVLEPVPQAVWTIQEIRLWGTSG